MENFALLSLILDSWNAPVVFADTGHIIRYLNLPAKKHYNKFGNIVGKSVFACHNEESSKKIREIFAVLQSGVEVVIYADNAKHRVYMRAVRDNQGQLLGYYERYEAPRADLEK